MAKRVWKTETRPRDQTILITDDEINRMSATELVDMLQRSGVRAHRGIGIDELRGVLRAAGGGEDVSCTNRIDTLRDLMNVVTEGYSRKAQVPPECPANCYLHPDLMVLHCALINKENVRWVKDHESAERRAAPPGNRGEEE